MDGTVGIPGCPTNPVEVHDDINAKLTSYCIKNEAACHGRRLRRLGIKNYISQCHSTRKT